MKKLIVLLVLILSACTTNPQIQYKQIDIPAEYLKDTGDLEKINPGVDLDGLALTIDANYKKYHTLREQLNSIRSYQSKMQNESNDPKN